MATLVVGWLVDTNSSGGVVPGRVGGNDMRSDKKERRGRNTEEDMKKKSEMG